MPPIVIHKKTQFSSFDEKSNETYHNSCRYHNPVSFCDQNYVFDVS